MITANTERTWKADLDGCRRLIETLRQEITAMKELRSQAGDLWQWRHSHENGEG
jgi:hypothetical protein